MMKKLVVLTILLSLCIQATAAIANTHNDAVDDDHNKTRSGTKATEAFCIENEVVTSFIQEEQYRDNDYSYTSIPKYRAIETDYRKDLPKPVIIKAPDRKDGDAFILETYCEGQLVRSDNFKIGEKSLEIWNLTPNKKYTYKLYLLSGKQKKEIASGAFRTEGQVRMLNIDGIDNCRDIGGWPLPNGQRVKYDQIFRSSELGWLLPHITEEGIYELLEVLEIEVEIDFGDFSYWSPVEDRIEFVHGTDYQILPYQDMLTKSGTQYKNCFEKLVNSLREGKKVLFHCTIGADRTGTFAFLLEGLLGVSESDLAKEYELTSFVYDERYRNIDYSWMMDDINKRFSGSTLNERIEKMALSFGISQKDIDDFRSLMTEKSICTTSADDTDMDFTILSYTNKTVQIGNGEESAIPQETPGVFEIPSTIQYYGSEYKIVSIGNCAFEDCNHLSSVKIPSGVTSIGEETFSGCSSPIITHNYVRMD